MGNQYIAANQGVTPTAGNVLNSVKSAANIVVKVTEVGVGGEATASTVNRMAVRRSTVDGVTPTAQTPAKASSSIAAAQATAATAMGTQPTFAAAPALWQYALNVFGGVIRWVAAPGQELVVQGATAGNDEISLASLAGTGLVTVQFVFEEI